MLALQQHFPFPGDAENAGVEIAVLWLLLPTYNNVK